MMRMVAIHVDLATAPKTLAFRFGFQPRHQRMIIWVMHLREPKGGSLMLLIRHGIGLMPRPLFFGRETHKITV